MLAAEARNLSAHAHMAELVLDGTLDRLGDLADGKFGIIGEASAMPSGATSGESGQARATPAASAWRGAGRLPIDCTIWLPAHHRCRHRRGWPASGRSGVTQPWQAVLVIDHRMPGCKALSGRKPTARSDSTALEMAVALDEV